MHHHGHHGHMAAHHCGPHGPRVVPMMGMAAMGAAAGAASTRPRTTYTPPRTNVIVVEKEKGHHSPTTTQQQQPSPPPAFSYPYAGAAPYPGGYGPYPGTQQGPYPGGPGPYQGAPGPYQGPPPPNPPPAGTAQNPYPQYSGGGGPYVGPGSPYRGPEAPYPTGEDDGKYSTQHRVSPTSAVASDQPKRATSLGKRWQNGNVIRLHSVTSTKNLRINKKGIVDGNGGSGQWAKFMIQRVSDDRIRLRNTGHGDTYLTLTPHHLSQGPPDVEAEFYVVKHVTKIKGERIYSLESVTYPGCFVGVDENGNVVTPCEVKAGLRGSFVVNVDKWA